MARKREQPTDLEGWHRKPASAVVWRQRYGTDIEALMSQRPHETNDTPSLEATAIVKEILGRAIDNLEDEDRFIVEALFIEGLSLRQVQAITGIPKTTVARRRDRIRRHLMADLSESPRIREWLRQDY